MDENWVKVYDTKQMIRAEIAREILEQNGIAAVIVNKQDSVYPMLGQCEVHVPLADFVQAQTILSNEDSLTESE
jgi:hypothetical protein